MNAPTPSFLDDDLARRLLDQRTVLLGTELDQNLSNRLTTALLMLAADDEKAPISLWINSVGGSVPGMLAIRDAMRLIPNTVATVNLGMAYSAGQFLLSAGTPGHRYLLPHSKVLLHQGSAGFGGTAGDIAIQAETLRDNRDTVLGLISADTGQPVETVEKDSRRDRWFNAQEAITYGFADHVVESLAQIRPAPQRSTGLGLRQAVSA